MTEAAVPAPPAAAAGPLGKPRGVGFVIVIGILGVLLERVAN